MTVVNKQERPARFDPRRHMIGRNGLGLVQVRYANGDKPRLELRRLWESYHLAEWTRR